MTYVERERERERESTRGSKKTEGGRKRERGREKERGGPKVSKWFANAPLKGSSGLKSGAKTDVFWPLK